MRHLSAATLIILLFVLPSCKFFRDRKLFRKKDDIMVTWRAKQDSIRVADSIQNVKDKVLAKEKVSIDSIRKADENRQTQESKYNIIIGSFLTPGYAKDFSEVYRKQGYNTQIIRMTGSRFELVSAETCNSLKEASSKLKIMQETSQIEAWIYIKK